jgi:polyferredoxin
MSSPLAWRLLADVALAPHVAFVAFVVLGLLLVVVGGFAGWRWIRNPWFRAGHFAAIGLVVGQAWCGVICPLTTLEMSLRERAGEVTYGGSFIAHWLQRLLYYNAPPWVFVVAYTVFGLLVVGTWWRFRPRPFRAAK